MVGEIFIRLRLILVVCLMVFCVYIMLMFLLVLLMMWILLMVMNWLKCGLFFMGGCMECWGGGVIVYFFVGFLIGVFLD